MPLHTNPQPPVTSQTLDGWLRAAHEQRAALHIKAAAPLDSDERQEAFAGMAALLQEALEKVRVASEALRDTSPAVGGQTIALREHYAHLREHSPAAMERLAQFFPYLPAAKRPTESQLPNSFKDERHRPR